MKHILLILLVFAGIAATATPVRIYGQGRSYKGSTLVVFAETDYISHQREVLAITEIDELGSFDFEFELSATREVRLVIASVEAILYAEPGATYHIVIPAYMAASGVKRFDKTMVEIQLMDPQMADLNVQLRSFNLDYAQFVKEHYYEFAIERYRGSEAYSASRKESLKESDMARGEELPENARVGEGGPNISNEGNWGSSVGEFKDYAQDTYGSYMAQNSFLSDYVNYQIASLELASGVPTKDLFEAYFFSQPIRYYNPAFMDFFAMFHFHLIEDELAGPNKETIQRAIQGKDWKQLQKYFEKDSTLQVDHVRSLAIVQALKESYYNRDIQKSAVEETLRRMSEEVGNKDVASVAARVKESLVKCTKGWQMEEVVLKDARNQDWSLTAQRGKYVYIFFYADWCTSCMKDMQLMEKIQEKYGTNVEFVSVSMDESVHTFREFVTKNQGKEWTFVYGPSDPLIKEKFKLRMLPAAMLLDPEGKVMYDVTRRPTEGLEADLEKLKQRDTKGGQIPGTWKN